MQDFSYQLWFAVRYVHVASIALSSGGAFLLATYSARTAAVPQLVSLAVAYEWVFWASIGIGVATGVGNLGLKGDGLLAANTAWGTALSVKLAVVLTFFALSLVRSDVVIRLKQRSASLHHPRTPVVLAVLYGLTAAAMFGAAWIGLGLAHGRY